MPNAAGTRSNFVSGQRWSSSVLDLEQSGDLVRCRHLVRNARRGLGLSFEPATSVDPIDLFVASCWRARNLVDDVAAPLPGTVVAELSSVPANSFSAARDPSPACAVGATSTVPTCPSSTTTPW